MSARWAVTVDVSGPWRDDDLTLAEKSRRVVECIRLRIPEGQDIAVDTICEELTSAGEDDDVRWFDDAWSAFYDWCDANRVWVNVWPRAQVTP